MLCFCVGAVITVLGYWFLSNREGDAASWPLLPGFIVRTLVFPSDREDVLTTSVMEASNVLLWGSGIYLFVWIARRITRTVPGEGA